MRQQYLVFIFTLLALASCIDSVDSNVFNSLEKGSLLSIPVHQEVSDSLGMKRWKRIERSENDLIITEKSETKYLFFDDLQSNKGKAEMYTRDILSSCNDLNIGWQKEWTLVEQDEETILYFSDSLRMSDVELSSEFRINIEKIGIYELNISFTENNQNIKERYVHEPIQDCENFGADLALANHQSDTTAIKKWVLNTKKINGATIDLLAECQEDAFIYFDYAETNTEKNQVYFTSDTLSENSLCKDFMLTNDFWKLNGDSIIFEKQNNRKIKTIGRNILRVEYEKNNDIYTSEYILR